MKIYNNKSVYESAVERIEYLFDEFPNVIAGISGGKDSTVVLNLCLEIAERKNRLPLKVLFIDQEAEWDCVIDHIREIYSDPRIEPLWYQIPLRLYNSTSYDEPWLQCWEPGKKWIREKEDISIKDNVFGSDRFADLFTKIVKHDYPDTPTCYISGVRTEESPARFIALTSDPTYKHITYGKKLNKQLHHYTFYPLYDWSYTDVWKYIHDNKIPYCKLYDYMYRYGLPIQQMRVSNVHHETAVKSLFYMQEVEPDNWNRIVSRIKGINTAGRMGSQEFSCPKKVPYMFKDWREYRDHLLENLLTDEKVKVKFRKKFKKLDVEYEKMNHIEKLYRVEINSILANDYHWTKIGNFLKQPDVHRFRIWKKTGEYADNERYNKFIR